LVAAILVPSVYPQIADYALIEVLAKQEGAQVIFEASWATAPNQSTSRVPVRIFDLSVYSNGWKVALWNIVTPNYVGATSRIVYGQVPQGFRQMIPDKGSPPKLTAGIYRVSVRGEGGIGELEFEVKAEK
jgi:hypothetical protein